MALPPLDPGGDPVNSPLNFTTVVYGTNASNAVSYSVGAVVAGGSITAALFNTLINNTNSERVRRGAGTTLTTVSVGTSINATHFNNIKTALEIVGQPASQAYNVSGTVTVVTYPQAAAPSGSTAVSVGTSITATGLNALITELNNAGAVCTCNCNYCTCNCNYACTCNCNYSDERVKTEIEYM